MKHSARLGTLCGVTKQNQLVATCKTRMAGKALTWFQAEKGWNGKNEWWNGWLGEPQKEGTSRFLSDLFSHKRPIILKEGDN